MGKNTSGFVALGWWQLPPQPSLRGATSWGSRTFGRPMPPKAVAAFARARWQPRLVGGANPDQLLCNSDTLNVASTHQDVSSRMMSMQQLHTISMALSNRICCVMWYCDVIFLFWVAPQSYKQRALAAPWKALDESCTGPDVVARNLAQTATERQSAALQGFYFGWFYDVLITPRSRAWTCLDQETMLFFFSAEYIQIVHVFEAGLGESCSDFALYLLFVWDAIVSCWTNQFDDVLASNGPALHCLWIMFFCYAGRLGASRSASKSPATNVSDSQRLLVRLTRTKHLHVGVSCEKGASEVAENPVNQKDQNHAEVDNRRWSVKHFEMHSYSWSLVLGQLSQVSWSGRWTWVWVMLPAAELQGPAVKTRKEMLPSLSYICGPWIEIDSVPAFRMNLGGLSRFYPFLPFVVSHCLCNWYDFDGSGVPISGA